MGRRVQKNPKNNKRSNRVSKANNKDARKNKKSKSKKPKDPPRNLGNILGKTVKRFCPFLNNSFKKLSDYRQQSKVTYSVPHFMWSGILMFLLLLESRRQYRCEKKSKNFVKNLLKLTQTKEGKACDPDTIGCFLEKLPPSELEVIPAMLVNHLIRSKALDHYRFMGYFLIAIDGTGIRKYNKRHCEHCLTSKDKKTGKTYYYHKLLEAKLTTINGFSFCIASEFIKNPKKHPTKQDCEFNAFKRLAPKLKQYFPKLNMCLLLDALYSKAPILKICKKNIWKYIITFKEGSMPTFYKEVWRIKQKNIANRKEVKNKNIIQTFSWVNFIEYQKDYLINALFCHEVTTKKDGSIKINDFAWITNINELSYKNVDKIANEAGRLRWNIEEAFNIQKNGGYNLEHSYSINNEASENWYYLMQIAHALNQIMTKSNLFIDFKAQMGSLKNFAKRLAEHLRFLLIDSDIWTNNNFQIRFNSS